MILVLKANEWHKGLSIEFVLSMVLKSPQLDKGVAVKSKFSSLHEWAPGFSFSSVGIEKRTSKMG